MSESDNSIKHTDRIAIADDIIKRIEITCGLFEAAFEIKSLELRRRHPQASDDWIRHETLRLIESGCK